MDTAPSTATRDRVALVIMPVVDIDRPSISIAKLRTVLDESLGERISTEIHYLCHEFAVYMADAPRLGGLDLHQHLLDNQYLGLPDWFFRHEAFPDLADNATAYFRRFFPGRSPEVTAFKEAIMERRAGLAAFLDGLIDAHKLDQATVVGFTSLFVQNGAVFAMARRLKQRNPDVTIVMGGQNCDSPMGEEYARNVDAIDYVFSGPALINFPQFMQHCLDGDRAACEQLPGVFSKSMPEREASHRAGGELDINVPVDLDYDEFFDSFETHFAGTGAKPQVHLETSRGCWWGERSHCTFCGLNGDTMNYRAMDADKAVTLFKGLFSRYSDKSDIFFTVDNILPKNYVEEVLPHINAPPGAKIFYEIKANMTPEELKVMADAGVAWVQPGIEALDTSSLRLMKKGSSAFVNLRLLKNCLRFGIDPIWSLLVGFPGEREEVYKNYVAKLPLVTHLRPPKGVASIHFDRFSPYFMRPEEFGLQLKPVDYYAYCFPFPEESIRNLAYFFADGNYEATHYTGLAPWMGPMQERVASWRDRWEFDGRDVWEYMGEGAARPQLELRESADGSGERIFDTRGNETLEFELSAAAASLARYLETERTEDAVRSYGEAQGFDGLAALAVLEEHGLVWREGLRMLSLIMLDDDAQG